MGLGDEVTHSAASALNRKEFNQALVKAVVHDNLAMTFGEGEGMIGFFHLVVPSAHLPSHQTFRKGLDGLFVYLSRKVQFHMKVSLSILILYQTEVIWIIRKSRVTQLRLMLGRAKTLSTRWPVLLYFISTRSGAFASWFWMF